ncbi:efflux RND transporter periplasmic adaptor subunit [Sulfitobacter sp.]|uniref:efflux RND transporter periplasmic adaptor subunit n=1 Tax=Sulfitobacter sp. TaxID=1903071 RepID=UPI0030015C23
MQRAQFEMKTKMLLLLLAAMLTPVTGLQAQEGPPPAAVTVVTLEKQNVTQTRVLPGRVVALGVAEVRPQVSGIILERLFVEGSEVTKGDPLYQIDDAIYGAQVQMSKATVEQAQVALSNAEKDQKRNAELFVRKVVSQKVVDDSNALRDEAYAAFLVAQAQLNAAQIDLDHSIITAPLSGVVGRALTTPGALVTAAQADPLAVIRQIDTVYVDVTASAADIVRRRRAIKLAGGDVVATIDPSVTLSLADGFEYDQTGSVLAIEPQVDPLTGVSVLRLKFPNPDGILLPGMYVNATIPFGAEQGVILAPQQGVSFDRRGEPTALVVNAENVVEPRTLKVEGTRGSDWIVTDGLVEGDRIIVAGLQKTAPGAVVNPQEQTQGDSAEQSD